jgi:hypothetical protein
MWKYILALIAALILVAGAFEVNTGDDTAQPQRVLPDTKDLQLH